MKKLSGSILFVTLALVILNIATLRELSRVDRHVAALEHDMAGLKATKGSVLSEAMALSQRWFDKLGRAGTAANWELAKFYADELQENLDGVMAGKIVTDGQEISVLLKTTLLPVLQELKKAATAGDPAAFATQYGAAVNACNSCHATTKRAFIKISSPSGPSPWAQDFGGAKP